MSFSKPPVVASSVALLAALSLVPTQGWARDGRNQTGGGDVIYEMAPMSSHTAQDVIYEMPPLRPVKGAAAQAAKPAKPAEPAVAAKPAPAPVKEAAPAQPPAPAPASVAEAPKPVEAPPQPVAEAPKPADAQPVAEAPPAAAPEIPPATEAAQQPAPAETPAAPVAEAPAVPAVPVAEATPPAAPELAGGAPVPAPVDGQGEVPQPAPAQQPAVAEAPAIVEPAPIGPPIMSVNLPRKALGALKAPAPFAGNVAYLQGDAPAPTLVPKLRSLAPEPAPAAAQLAAEPGTEAQQPMAEAASADSAAAQAAAAAKISALLSEGLVGPVEVRIGDRATMWLPAGRVFLPLETARKLAQEAGLEWRPGVQGMVAPAGGKLEWLAPVELLDDGYVKTGDAEQLQPEKLFCAFQASLPEVNAQRARAGQPPVALDGWLSPPALNEKHRLAGCVNISTQNDQSGLDKFFNCEAWALGRQGAIKIGLADGAEAAARLKDEAAALADTIVFDRGKTYEEFDAATDKTAPYAAADLLTRDVTAKTAPAAPAAEASAPGESSDLISKLFYPAAFGVGALALYALIKRRREAEKGDEAQAETMAAPARIERTPEARRAPETPATVADEAQAAPSLFARLLPTLHARFTKKDAPAPKPEILAEPSPVAAEAASAAEAAPSLFARLLPTLHARLAKKDAPAPKPEILEEPALVAAGPKAEPYAKENSISAVGGLMGKIAALRSRNAEEPKATPSSVGAAPANDAEEPASALKKLAAKMRRTSEEPAPPPVNVSRVMRTRSAGAAAAAVADSIVEPLIVETEQARVAEPEIALLEPELLEPNAPRPIPAAPAPAAPSMAMEELDEVEEVEAFAPPPATEKAQGPPKSTGPTSSRSPSPTR
ncbi:DUF2167 domain-containing protein [Methylocystis parvus]|uniref:DUF2167 domain-containing protein n=1 Tax=Methylocystis parvus TaxID=134 RepID=UPI003C76704E